MARLVLAVFLGLFQLTFSAPSRYNQTADQITGQTTDRLIGNSFGIPGQNLTYDYIVCALLSLTSISRLN